MSSLVTIYEAVTVLLIMRLQKDFNAATMLQGAPKKTGHCV